MSFLVDGIVVVAMVMVGRSFSQALRARRSPPTVSGRRKEVGLAPSDAFAPFPCKLGDVLLRRIERDEAWLAGALVFADTSPRAALFVAPEAEADRGIFVFEGSAEVLWLAPWDRGFECAPLAPPVTVEFDGVCFNRLRRLPVQVSSFGAGAPAAVGERAVVAEYAAPGGVRIIVIAGVSATRVWRGVLLRDCDYEVWPGSDASQPSNPAVGR